MQNYYHIRSFLIKYPRNKIVKSVFPWLINWFYNYVGSNKIGKGSTIEEQFGADKFVEIGNNSYIGVNGGISSHAVDGIFGNISYYPIKIGNNVTAAALNCIAPGVEIQDNSYLLPAAGATKFNSLKGDNYYFGAPLRKIFRKKIMDYLQITEEEMERGVYLGKIGKDIKPKETKKEKKHEETKKIEEVPTTRTENKATEQISSANNEDFVLDFMTSSAISRVGIKFLILYIPVLLFSGILVISMWYNYFLISTIYNMWIFTIWLLPFVVFASWFVFLFFLSIFTKLFLIIINLIHRPKEGVFRAEKGDKDFEFWCLRNELKKLVMWFLDNSPLPYVQAWGLRWFEIKMDFSSHMVDAWVDVGFIDFGRKVMVGQGALVMSSMVVGKYLIIKKVVFDDYTVIGGVSTISPGTFVGRDTIIGAFTTTTFNQLLEPGWIYLGIPANKLKPNRYAESKRNVIVKKDVEKEEKYEAQTDVLIDDDKKYLL